MPVFRKKPVEVEAIRWDGENETLLKLYTWSNTKVHGSHLPGNYLRVITLEGTMTVDVGDYVIKGVKGEFYPCKPDIFAATYEAVDINEVREQGLA